MKDPRIYIIQIRDCITRIETYTEGGRGQFFEDLKTQDAIIRNLEVMADATQQLPEDWKAAYPATDWRGIADFRNFLAHQYLEIDLDIVWNVVENYVPELKVTVELIAAQFWEV
ncbi:DUF86 domain-containing protein [filamentous cyanobacterium CCP5]|nr:DUF86 domain-containing protein [filamentous cyanobacterium CCP5]